MSKITDDELINLSAQERAALEDEEGAVADDAEAAPAADAEAAPVADDAEAAPAADDAEAAPAADDAEAAPAADDDDEPFVPQYRAEPVENYQEQMAALDKAFEEGEIKLADYNSQRDELIRQQTKAEILADQNRQLAQQRWEWEIKRFIRDTAKNDGIDYNKPLLNAALDAAVKNLATATDAYGNLLHSDRDGEWFLQEAHKLVKAELGLATKPAASAPPPKARNVPTTLSQVPQAEIPDTGVEDPFAHIDKLFESGRTEAAEMELAKMSKLDQQRYLRAQ